MKNMAKCYTKICTGAKTILTCSTWNIQSRDKGIYNNNVYLILALTREKKGGHTPFLRGLYLRKYLELGPKILHELVFHK